jgi:NADPH:quinone reductase-like Zn-dependent oxidoreductase
MIMKAIICKKYGSPEVLEVQEVEKPSPKENELLVRVISTAVNSGDVRVRGLVVEGFMKLVMQVVLGFSKPKKPILGTVFSGIVESIGKNVVSFKTGDRVFGMTGFQFGTYAEYLTIREKSAVTLMPQNANFEEAVSLIFGGQTAIYFLEKAKIQERKNPKVLIIGSTGAVGTSTVQIANTYGALVSAVCSSRGETLMKELGVTNLFLYDKEDFMQTNQRYDIIFDAVGKCDKKKIKTLLNTGGVFKSVEGLDVASETKEQLLFLKNLFEAGKLKAVIDKMYSMEEVVEAHRYVDSGRKKGNVVLKIGED